MSLYFMQHGLALDKAVDPDRSLSEEGIHQVVKMARFLELQEHQIVKVFHSGKTRAQQTAALIGEVLEINSVQAHASLNPMDNVNELIPLLSENSLYVGHLPQLEKLVSKLICNNESQKIMSLENAAIVCINHSTDGYYINWLIKPSNKV